jgi:hypothetical protein
VQFQLPMMAPQPHDLDDPRMAAMLLNNSHPFAQNNSQALVPSAGYPTVNALSTPRANGAAGWVPSQIPAFTTGPLYTPPSNSLGLPGIISTSGSPVGGVSADGTSASSPASTTSSLSSYSSGSVVPSNHPLGFRRERSGSLNGNSPGSRSPPYELHHAAMQDFAGVPRVGGMCGASFVPSHHHMLGQGLGMQTQAQSFGVGGGANALMMMV